MSPKWFLLGTIIGLILFILGFVLGWAIAPPIIEDKIIESTALIKGTEQFERFEELPVPLLFKVYIFAVQNRDEITAGEKPIVKEVGPYVYKQYRTKHNIEFRDNGNKVQYEQKQLFEFDEKASSPLKESDMHVVLNVPLMGAFKLELLLSSWSEKNINSIFQATFTDMFLELSVKDFLFDGIPMCHGPNPPFLLCSGLRVQAKGGNVPTFRMDGDTVKFAFFHFKNDTTDGVWEVATGHDDISKLGSIESWKGNSIINTWGSEVNTCNEIKGSDSSLFPPFRTTDGYLSTFSADICRTVDIEFVGKSEYAGIESYRYETTEDFLSEVGEVQGNECYCLNVTKGIRREDGCLFKGAMELKKCVGADVVLTLPHFLGAHQNYKDLITGLSPDEDKHKIFAELEPHTGIPLRGGKRVQFNMFLQNFDGKGLAVPWTNNFVDSLLPILWVDEGIELNDEMINMLNDKLLNNLIILEAVKWTLIAVGAALAICFIILYFCKRNRGSENV